MSLSCISAAASEAVVFLFPPDCFSPHQVSSCCLLLSLFIIVVFLSGAIWAFQPWRFRVFNLFTPDLTTVGDWGVGMFLFSFLFSFLVALPVFFCLVLLSMAGSLSYIPKTTRHKRTFSISLELLHLTPKLLPRPLPVHPRKD
jgi:hypothetical protein